MFNILKWFRFSYRVAAKLQRQFVLIPTSPLALLAAFYGRASMTDYRAPLHRLLSQKAFYLSGELQLIQFGALIAFQ
jgi:hypothetical protein